jgi:preprotein translocase subunit SecG
MTVLISVGTVLFLVLAVLMVILILLQSDKSAGMGILGGSSQSTFGSSTADIITKITGVMVAIFMLGSLGLAVLESYRVNSIEKEFGTTATDKSEIVKDKPVAGEAQNTGANPAKTAPEGSKETKK